MRYVEAFIGGLGFLLVGLFAAALIYGVAEVIKLALNLPSQRTAEKSASELLSQLKRREPTPPFFLYLRSFHTDFTMDWFNLIGSRQYAPSFFQGSFDEQLAKSLAPFGLLVCLGTRGYELGAARIASTDDQWRSDVALLLQDATLVILVPGHTDGVMEEFAEILKSKSLEKKAVFFMPPDASGILVEQQWNLALLRFREQGLVLPAYQADGALFNSRGDLISWRDVNNEVALYEAAFQLTTENTRKPNKYLPRSK